MTDIEKKFIFTVIGFLILIMIVVLSIKSSNKNKLEQQKASENNTQLEDYVTSFEKIGSDVKVNNNEDLAKTNITMLKCLILNLLLKTEIVY
mgnify:CR=1 FL=1